MPILMNFRPYHCEVSEDATGKAFKPIETTKQVPGVKSKSTAKNEAFPMAVKLPAGTKCTGPSGACLVRCKNENSQREYRSPRRIESNLMNGLHFQLLVDVSLWRKVQVPNEILSRA
jgi:hypothetical protein